MNQHTPDQHVRRIKTQRDNLMFKSNPLTRDGAIRKGQALISGVKFSGLRFLEEGFQAPLRTGPILLGEPPN